MPVIGSTLFKMGYTEGLADVVCSPDRSKCRGKPHSIVEAWIRVFVLKDPTFNSSTIDLKMLDDIFEKSVKEYTEVMSTNSPDLSEFRKRGGRMLQYHGLVRIMIFMISLTWLGGPCDPVQEHKTLLRFRVGSGPQSARLLPALRGARRRTLLLWFGSFSARNLGQFGQVG
jgi:hypothetical protein